MRRLVLRRQAELEIAVAIDWYQARNPAAARHFALTVEETLIAVSQNPFHYQTIEGEIHRVVVQTFPYLIVYFVTDSEVVVTACVHTSRDPNAWRERF